LPKYSSWLGVGSTMRRLARARVCGCTASRVGCWQTIVAGSVAALSSPSGCDLAGRDAPQAPSGELAELAAAFGSLAGRDREVLALEAWEGLNAGEVAAVLGCSRNAARIRLHRARRRVRAAIADLKVPDQTVRRPRAASGSPTRVVEAPGTEQTGAREYRPGHADDLISMRGSV
jgi:hypothetical protein